MGKHSKEKEKKKINVKKIIVIAFIVVILIFGLNFTQAPKEEVKEEKDRGSKSSSTIEEKKLVIKSKSDYNKIIEYTFENNILKTVKIYEQFEKKEQFEAKKNNYEMVNNIEIIDANEQELSIEIEKKDLGSDTDKSYEELYDKYLVQIIGAYEVL